MSEVIEHPMDEEKLKIVGQIADYLLEYFKDDPRKAIFWILAINPNFGYIRPCDLINKDRHKKVLKFIENSRDGNMP